MPSPTPPYILDQDNYLTQAVADARYAGIASIGSSTPQSIDNGDAGAAGTSTSLAREDHEHPFTIPNYAQITNPPACRVYHSGDQNVTSGAELTLAFDSERYDTDTMHDPSSSNSRITFNTAGLYVVTGHATIQNDVDTDHRRAYLSIKLNGSTVIAVQLVGRLDLNVQPHISVATVYKFAQGDYVELIALQQNTDSDTRPVQALGNFSPEFSATWIGVG